MLNWSLKNKSDANVFWASDKNGTSEGTSRKYSGIILQFSIYCKKFGNSEDNNKGDNEYDNFGNKTFAFIKRRFSGCKIP